MKNFKFSWGGNQNEIKFEKIKGLFDEKKWDIAYLSKDGFERVGNSPIKYNFHHIGYDKANSLHRESYNGIILARHCTKSNDYSLYDESYNILKKEFIPAKVNLGKEKESFLQTYLNFKEAALLSGLGYRARNSLIYNRKFGFQCRFTSFMFGPQIVDYEILERKEGLLDLCEGCDDCIKNCPVRAIHEDWVDASKCDNFIGFGNHPTIPSIKWFWYEKIGYKKYSREEVESWTRYEEEGPLEWGQGIDGFYESSSYGLLKDGVPIDIPHCQECTSQPRCSKAPLLD